MPIYLALTVLLAEVWKSINKYSHDDRKSEKHIAAITLNHFLSWANESSAYY
jgi:hypothetical protein